MDRNTIVLTGAAGFIGSCLLTDLIVKFPEKQIVIVDDFTREIKTANYRHKGYTFAIERELFVDWLKENGAHVSQIYHLGARTDTAEQDVDLFNELNVDYTKAIWSLCAKYDIPLLYASSAATYGGGEHGYDDKHDNISELEPLNPYGRSKNDFDIWALAQEKQPPHWYGVKYFNVYGPNEYHKGRMASVIFQTFNQIKETGEMKLFKSHRPDFKDGEQSRDFIYVKDVIKMCLYLMNDQPSNGLYNIGTGQARTFYDLAKATFIALGLEPKIGFRDTPADIRGTYQYFTEANMDKLRDSGYRTDCYSLEDGVKDYVQNYLSSQVYY